MPHRNASLAISFASAGVSLSSALVAASTGEPGAIAIATISAVKTKIVWIRMLFIRCLRSVVFGMRLHHVRHVVAAIDQRCDVSAKAGGEAEAVLVMIPGFFALQIHFGSTKFACRR